MNSQRVAADKITQSQLNEIFSNSQILKIGKGRKSRYRYNSFVCAFDIETTNLDEICQAIMYIWQFQIDEKVTVIGRTWEEFIEFLEKVVNATKGTIVVYVHNLSFEWNWLRYLLPVENVFALDNRKILRFNSDRFEFRCSMLHSNMSLKKFLEKMEVEHQKLEMDYNEKRFPWTELTEEVLDYSVNDVVGLVEAIKKEMERDGDDLYSIPLTSTGYVRRRTKEAISGYIPYFKEQLPNGEVFRFLRMAFRGGNTHANRYNSNIVLKNVYSYDIASSYPSVLLTEKFPTKFERGNPSEVERYLKMNMAVLMKVRMHDVRLKNNYFGCPYIPIAKCYKLSADRIDDNGRVLSASDIVMYLTEIDLQIIAAEYDFDLVIESCFVSKKRYLPPSFRSMVFGMFKQKTSLKGIDDYMYMKYKNMINSLYGMCVMNPLRDKYVLKNGILVVDEEETNEKKIADYQKHGWLPYQIGVYCTAYARLKLEMALQKIPYDDFVYADTDSVKFINEHDDVFAELNELFYDEKYTAVDREGNIHAIGIFEYEGMYDEFKTMGAKKYCYTDEKGLHVTISGVSKKKGAKELESIENFQEGFVFKESGGQEAVYNDEPYGMYKIDGHEINIIPNLYLRDSTYTLSLTADYRRLLNYICSTNISKDLLFDYKDEKEEKS